ncbi:DNAH10 [Cordylochernes scorpioides]|uniref:DNAH10 n=1 Tax=Cordylochernes scorpioides TaxID=51811 RepID=A0ABY6KAU5_9ARAC|nr:DNAH10 [Cordylochernes scorpioides]
MQLYQLLIQKLPPTPTKFHYIFNLRDLSRIYSGLCLTTPAHFHEPRHFVRVWRNECLRVFYDRLVSDEDRTIVNGKLESLVEDNYREHKEDVLRDPILYGDYRNALDTEEPRLYEDLGDYATIKSLFEEVLKDDKKQESSKMETNEIRAVIKYICKKGMSPKEIYEDMVDTLREDTSSYSTVKNGKLRFN